MKKLIIYTCITGDYDDLVEPECSVPEWVQFVCFTSHPVESKIWEWRPIPHTEATPAMTSRWPKINPHLALGKDTGYSLWMDGNLVIKDTSFFDKIRLLMESGVKYAGIHHPSRDDVYDEAYKVLGRESFFRLVKITCFLHRQGFPRHYGLMENNMILRRHNDSQVVIFDNLWWSIIKKYSFRDQLSQTYCLWKTGLDPQYIFPEGESSRNSDSIRYVFHDREMLADRSIRGRWNVYSSNFKKICFRIWLLILL